MGDRIRIEVEDFTAGYGVIVYIDPAGGTPQDRAAIAPILGQAICDLARDTGHTETWARDALLACLCLRYADTGSYQREAARRGVLAL